MYRSEPALFDFEFSGEGFEWVDCQSADDSVLAFVRKGKDPRQAVLVCANFTPVVRQNHRVGVPWETYYREIFNSDSQHYQGSNVGNYPGVAAEKIEWHGRPWSISMTLPPLAISVFKAEL